MRTRRLRAALSALGIAIGVAAIVAVLGISSSSQAGLLAEINQLGTNLLDVTTGQNFSGQSVPLPLAAPGMIGRIGPVYDVAYTGALANANAYRSPLIPSVNTNALSVAATSLNLPGAVGTTVAQGELPQRRDRDRAGLRARRRRRPAARHRPHLPRRADLGRRHVVLRRRHPQAGRARPRDRRLAS